MLKSIELPVVPLLPPPASPERTDHLLSQSVRRILVEPSLDCLLSREPDPEHLTTHHQSASWIDHCARDELHRALLLLYQQHMRLPHEGMSEYQFHPLPSRLMHELQTPWERDMLRRARSAYNLSLDALPSAPEDFSAWYRDTAFGHLLYEHDLYAFVASEAERHQLEWFFRMECAGEAAFDDLLALAQVGTRGDVKMEMATNFWDEMGRGKSHAVHTQ